MPHVRQAFEWLDQNVEKIKALAGNPRSMLYVGVRHDMRPWWHNTFGKNLGVTDFGVLEIFPPNMGHFQRQCDAGKYPGVNKFILGDIRDIEKITKPFEFDIVFWDHGPEHITEEDLRKVTPVLQGMVDSLLLYCGPWGPWPQGAEDGNGAEEHLCVLTPELMQQMGMDDTVTFNGYGRENEGELVSWYSTGYGTEEGT